MEKESNTPIKLNIIRFPRPDFSKLNEYDKTKMLNLLDDALQCNENDVAILFEEMVKDILMVRDLKGDGSIYAWFEETCLWVEMTTKQCCSWLPQVIIPFIQIQISLMDSTIKRLEEEIQLLQDRVRNINISLANTKLDLRSADGGSLTDDKENLIDSKKEQVEALISSIRSMRKLIKSVSSMNFVSNVLKFALPRLFRDNINSVMNYNKNYLPINCQMKVNLKDGVVSKRVKEDYFTFNCQVSFSGLIPDSEKTEDQLKYKKIVNDFMNDVFLGDVEVINFVKKMIGYSFTGETSEQKMFILYGEGANGKSTLMNILRSILNRFYHQASKDVFIQCGKASAGANSPHLVSLQFIRMCIFSESEVDDKLSEGQIKMYTGNEPITTTPKYMSQMTFENNGKAWFLTNHLPTCSNDNALWRRIAMIPCLAKFVDKPTEKTNERQLKNFDNLIHNEEFKTAFFGYAVEGAIEWYKNRLTIPECIKQSTKEYKDQVNIYETYINDRIIKSHDPKKHITGGDLYRDFKHWFADEGYTGKVPPNKIFGMEMKKLIKCSTHYHPSTGLKRDVVVSGGIVKYLEVSLRNPLADI